MYSKYLKAFPFRSIDKTVVLTVLVLSVLCLSVSCGDEAVTKEHTEVNKDILHTPPDTSTIPHDEFGDMVRYGRALILNTAYYLGPNGIVSKNLGNKMNCTNCHLDAGTRAYGLNFFSSHARYPQYRARENRILTLAERVNNCIERPHNGIPIPLDSKEMIAIVSYMKWLSANVPIGHRVPGDDGTTLKYPDRPADPEKGKVVYAQHCSSCHGADGQGVFNMDSITYAYPPLWGSTSYEAGSSMHRVLKAARFIKANMPFNKATWKKPVLTDEEAIDVAAFINDDRIHTRPHKENGISYPNYRNKPIDYDEGPFPDTFSAFQHKFGPFQPIIDYHKKKAIPVSF
jgi:thiosulfate dehydrogenase